MICIQPKDRMFDVTPTALLYYELQVYFAKHDEFESLATLADCDPYGDTHFSTTQITDFIDTIDRLLPRLEEKQLPSPPSYIEEDGENYGWLELKEFFYALRAACERALQTKSAVVAYGD
ncbi:MAG: hypothetical protein AAGK09_02215 [Planctomycetota bacterium]